MKIVVGVTDNRWAAFLRDRDDIVEANFWQPSPHGFKALPEGGPFLSKTKDPSKYRNVNIPGYSMVGGGFCEEYRQLRVSEAWTIWGTGNGVASEADLLERVHGYRSSTTQDFDPDPFIGCIILRNLFFARRGDELPQPTHRSRNIVVSRGYDATDASFALDAEEVTEAFQLLLSRPASNLPGSQTFAA